MITDVLLSDGRKISAGEAIQLRDSTKEDFIPIYMDPSTGDTVLKPRKGHKTKLSHARSHFYHPSDIVETGLGSEKSKALDIEHLRLDSMSRVRTIPRMDNASSFPLRRIPLRILEVYAVTNPSSGGAAGGIGAL